MALSGPAGYTKSNALIALYLGHFSGLGLQGATLEDEGMSPPKRRAGRLLSTTEVNFPSLVLLSTTQSHCLCGTRLGLSVSPHETQGTRGTNMTGPTIWRVLLLQ